MQDLQKSFLKERQHVDYSHVTLDRLQWSALANTVRTHKRLENYWLVASPLVSQEYQLYMKSSSSTDSQYSIFNSLRLRCNYFQHIFSISLRIRHGNVSTRYTVLCTVFPWSSSWPCKSMLLASCMSSAKYLHHLCLHGISISQQSNYIIDLTILTYALP